MDVTLGIGTHLLPVRNVSASHRSRPHLAVAVPDMTWHHMTPWHNQTNHISQQKMTIFIKITPFTRDRKINMVIKNVSFPMKVHSECRGA